MQRHPYRDAAPPRNAETELHSAVRLEEHAVHAVFFVVGSLGVLVGWLRPTCSVELSLGLLILFFTGRSAIERVRPRRE